MFTSRMAPAILVLAVLALFRAMQIRSGILVRAAASAELARVTDQSATPVVHVVHPKSSAPLQEIVLRVTPVYIDSPIFVKYCN